jgi:hypothetical protein
MTTTADEVIARMRQVRCELGEDMQGIVDNARVMTDWRQYIRSYPWVCVGVAALAGFLIVPRRPEIIQPDPKDLAKLVKSRHIVVKAEQQAPAGKSVAGSLASTLGGLLLQGGMALGRQYLTSYWRARQTAAALHDGNGEVLTP